MKFSKLLTALNLASLSIYNYKFADFIPTKPRPTFRKSSIKMRKPSKYMPHQGAQEIARRLRQADKLAAKRELNN